MLATRGPEHRVIDFFPYGYDERQYNSPGFRLPVGSLMRGRHGTFPEYHTSADDLDLRVRREDGRIPGGPRGDRCGRRRRPVLVNQSPYGEPQLGRRGLYGALGGSNIPDGQLAMLWVLNLSDGEHSLIDIAQRAAMPFATVAAIAEVLVEHGLLADQGRPQ